MREREHDHDYEHEHEHERERERVRDDVFFPSPRNVLTKEKEKEDRER